METELLKDRAEELFGRRWYRRSIKAYLELIEREPRDPRLRVRFGELARRLGRMDEAARAYRVAADLFVAQGHKLRARAAGRMAMMLAT